ncbi:hypothetical protein SDC9_207367 [bioreactor metagenome]|uniref:Uncharacterized protein n=1 Tax=bioreactor metagenome TaxID=1076179 RepID=A0A645J885_9ZZZZ
MRPRSSETIITLASVSCDIPSPARCRNPRWVGIFGFWEMGRIQPAAFIFCPTIIMAPSCSGLFLKKIFSMSREDMSAFTISPVCSYNPRWISPCTAMSAPVFVFDIFMQASTIAVRYELSFFCFSLGIKSFEIKFHPFLEPSDIRKRRISS